MFPNIEIVEAIRKEYPVGTRVRLTKMDDIQAPPLGTEGTVASVDKGIHNKTTKYGLPTY